MSRFSRAYEGAISAANLTKAQAAAAAGMDASVVSRILSDERDATREHVADLIRALPDHSDRQHCVLEFLADQCPPEYRGSLVVHFGAVQESKTGRGDSFAANLATLEREATDNPELRKLVANLVKIFSERSKT